jgi:hypothetical protein
VLRRHLLYPLSYGRSRPIIAPGVRGAGQHEAVDLADFLPARITEDENTARGSTAGPWRWFPGRAGLPAFLESTGATARHWVEGQSFEAPTVALGSNRRRHAGRGPPLPRGRPR